MNYQDDKKPTLARYRSLGNVLSVVVDGFTDIIARVFRVDVEDVQRHKAQVEDVTVTVTGREQLAVAIPLDSQRGVLFGLDATLKVYGFSLSHTHRLNLWRWKELSLLEVKLYRVFVLLNNHK